MKKLSNYLKVQTVKLDLDSKDKNQLLKDLYESFSNAPEITDKKKCFEDILEREN